MNYLSSIAFVNTQTVRVALLTFKTPALICDNMRLLSVSCRFSLHVFL